MNKKTLIKNIMLIVGAMLIITSFFGYFYRGSAIPLLSILNTALVICIFVMIIEYKKVKK